MRVYTTVIDTLAPIPRRCFAEERDETGQIPKFVLDLYGAGTSAGLIDCWVAASALGRQILPLPQGEFRGLTPFIPLYTDRRERISGGRVERPSIAQSVIARHGRSARRAEGDASARSACRDAEPGRLARAIGGARLARRVRHRRCAPPRDSGIATRVRRR